MSYESFPFRLLARPMEEQSLSSSRRFSLGSLLHTPANEEIIRQPRRTLSETPQVEIFTNELSGSENFSNACYKNISMIIIMTIFDRNNNDAFTHVLRGACLMPKRFVLTQLN